MNYEVNVHELFWLDVAEARVYYESVSYNVADHFDEEFDITYKELCRNPEAYLNLSNNIRRIPIQNFPYQIIYSFKKSTISIWCLHHAFSNKKEWVQRSRK